MSGRPKHTEAEDLRELTRAAHEAIKDLRQVLREIRAAQAEHAAFLDTSLHLAAEAGAEQIGNVAQQTLDCVQSEVDRVMAYVARLAGAASAADLTGEIINHAAGPTARGRPQARPDLRDHGPGGRAARILRDRCPVRSRKCNDLGIWQRRPVLRFFSP